MDNRPPFMRPGFQRPVFTGQGGDINNPPYMPLNNPRPPLRPRRQMNAAPGQFHPIPELNYSQPGGSTQHTDADHMHGQMQGHPQMHGQMQGHPQMHGHAQMHGHMQGHPGMMQYQQPQHFNSGPPELPPPGMAPPPEMPCDMPAAPPEEITRHASGTPPGMPTGTPPSIQGMGQPPPMPTPTTHRPPFVPNKERPPPLHAQNLPNPHSFQMQRPPLRPQRILGSSIKPDQDNPLVGEMSQHQFRTHPDNELLPPPPQHEKTVLPPPPLEMREGVLHGSSPPDDLLPPPGEIMTPRTPAAPQHEVRSPPRDTNGALMAAPPGLLLPPPTLVSHGMHASPKPLLAQKRNSNADVPWRRKAYHGSYM